MGRYRDKGLTLVELIITMVLLSVVILAATTFDYSSVYLFESSRKKAILVDEMSLLLEHMAKYATFIVGDVNNRGIVVDANHSGINLRIDKNGTPDNYADDTWVRYQRVHIGGLQYGVEFCEDASNPSSCSPLTKKLVPSGGNLLRFDSNSYDQFSISNVALRYDPTSPENARKNPQVFLTEPVVFASLSHSIN